MAKSSPIMVTVRAASLSMGCIVNTGVFKGNKFEEIRKPAVMLPHASRLIGLITEGLFSLMGTKGANRGYPADTKNRRRRL